MTKKTGENMRLPVEDVKDFLRHCSGIAQNFNDNVTTVAAGFGFAPPANGKAASRLPHRLDRVPECAI
jgi:hypothetical protein